MQEMYIDTDAALEELCTLLHGQPVLALDTEFMREKTYYAQLCLLQVAAEGVVACVDPLALDNLEPLLSIIYDESVTKVLHAARQDLEIFHDLRGRLPEPVFDTQIAATLLGYGDQIGYAKLVKQMLGVELDKLATRTDWSQRPLDAEQLHYAADDVRYLFRIYHLQLAALDERGRRDWLQEDFQQLLNRDSYAPAEENLWKRVRGSQRLKGVQLAVLRELAIWREQRARESNRPRRWVLKDEVMCDIAQRCPVDLASLEKIRGLESRFIKQQGAKVISLVKQAKGSASETWPVRPGGRRLTPDQEVLVDLLLAVTRYRAIQNEVSPVLLATRKDLEALVLGDRDCPVLHGWRAELAGHDLQAVMSGELLVQVRNGHMELVAAK